jgi:SAM-dependent methyltransferase
MKFFDRADNTPENRALLNDYDALVAEKLGPDYPFPTRMRDWELFEVLKHLRPVSGHCRVIDTGSYNTYLGIWLARFADEVIVSDLLMQRLAKSLLRRFWLLPKKPTEAPFARWHLSMRRASSKIRIRQVDLTRMPFPDGHFDYITSISVVEHIPRIQAAIGKMYHCLKPGGMLLLTTDCSPEGKPYGDGVRYFTVDELDETFRPYPVVSERRASDFRRENWCYHGDRSLLTAFAAIKKPSGGS